MREVIEPHEDDVLNTAREIFVRMVAASNPGAAEDFSELFAKRALHAAFVFEHAAVNGYEAVPKEPAE